MTESNFCGLLLRNWTDVRVILWQASIVQFLWSTPQKLDNQLQRIAHFLTFEQLHLFLSFFAYQTLPNAVLYQQNNQNLGDQGIFSRFGMS